MWNFTDQNGSKGGPHENEFWLFSNTKINVTNRVEKIDEKWADLSSFQVSFLSCLEKYIFYNFALTSARNVSLLKQFTYFILKLSLHSFRKWYGL